MNNIILLFSLFLITSSLGSSIEPKLDHFILHDGYFYAIVKNRYEIVKLDKDGNEIATIGRRGRGPSEFATATLNMTFVGDTLYVYDGINKRLTLLDENLNNIKDTFPKDVIQYIASYQHKLYGMVLKLPVDKKDNDRSIKAIKRTFNQSDFVIKSIYGHEKELATFKNNILTPVYSYQKVKSNGDMIVLYHLFQNNFRIYYDHVLTNVTIPGIEPLALGKKMKLKGEVTQFYKDYPYFPAYYTLVHNIILTDKDFIIIQVQSYKKGNQLIFYNLKSKKIIKTISSPKGKLIGRDASYFYFYQNNAIKNYTLSQLTTCPHSHLTFYIDSFKEQCYSCKQAFFKLYDWARKQNIPYNFVIKDEHWITSPGRDDYRNVVDYMHQWSVWGAVSFKSCATCFKNGMHVRINRQKKIVPLLPASLPKVYAMLSCQQK